MCPLAHRTFSRLFSSKHVATLTTIIHGHWSILIKLNVINLWTTLCENQSWNHFKRINSFHFRFPRVSITIYSKSAILIPIIIIHFPAFRFTEGSHSTEPSGSGFGINLAEILGPGRGNRTQSFAQDQKSGESLPFWTWAEAPATTLGTPTKDDQLGEWILSIFFSPISSIDFLLNNVE